MRFINVALLMALLVVVFSCKEKDLYSPEVNNEPVKVANTFDFSTIKNVKLTVDYSAFETYGPVFFSVYAENPIITEGEEEYLDESISPIFEDYTNADGRYNMLVQLPSYATHLYVVTGHFLVNDHVIEVNVEKGVASAVASNPVTSRKRSAVVTRSGQQTDDISTMPYLSFIVDEKGNNTGERIYKDWLTPLGTWDSESGRPSYILQPGEADPELFFTSDEIAGLYSTVGQALNTNKTCSSEYLDYPDLTLEKASEVSLTLLGGSTCWNCTMGYYYYKESEHPSGPADLNIIMLFPNTQDGLWANFKSNMNYNGNIALNRGDAVQLMYYPNIANNGDLSEATKIFPAGIRIGFILKTNGWGMQNDNNVIKGFGDGKRKYNVWGSSTPGASYCRPFGQPGKAPYQYPNPEGKSRSAKFSYISPEGDKYAIVSFEDACNDQDYDDVIFALKPVNAFTPLPMVEDKKSTTMGVYAFEDLWPNKGDYDLNDVIVDYKHEKLMSKQSNEKEYKIIKETFYLTTYQNYVDLKSGLALKLNTPVSPSSVVMKKMAAGSTEVVEANYAVADGVYYLTSDVKAELGTTYIIEVNYSKGQTTNSLASVQPFIYREEANDMTWEVHIPFEAPTSKMVLGYFGTKDDASIPEEGKYFVRDSDYPFAFFLYGANIENFKNTILKRENESKKIDEIYPGFLKWSTTQGAEDADWYLHPIAQ